MLDDESFFTLKNDELGGFYTNDKNTPPSVKYKFKAKYKKLLVWLAISENGHLAPYFCPSGSSVNGDIYILPQTSIAGASGKSKLCKMSCFAKLL